jgi:hypothetical protein
VNTRPSAMPSAARAWELYEHAFYKGNSMVLGWADDMVMGSNNPMTFTVHPRPDSHEDEVLIIAVRVPHPDYMTLEQVVADDVPISGS